MVQAIIDGRKTQTRRVVKPQPMKDSAAPHKDGNQWLHMGEVYKCPYGQPGDILWVRETWCWNGHYYVYKSEHEAMPFRWKPSIHMPFAAARIFLRVKSVRVERLQEISEADAVAEGATPVKIEVVAALFQTTSARMCYRNGFKSLWQSINGPESWDANPWVWVVEFERISREEALNV